MFLVLHSVHVLIASVIDMFYRLMESFVPLGGFFSMAAADTKSPLSSSYHTASRCHLCNEKCKQEVNTLSKCGLISTVSVADHYQSSLPSWLQMTQLNTNGGLDPMKVCLSHNSTPSPISLSHNCIILNK